MDGRSSCIQMRKFRFRLEAVRRLRAQEEQVVQGELAAVLRDRACAQAELDASLAAEQGLYSYMRDTGLSVDDLAHVTRYSALHRQVIVRKRTELHVIDEQVARVRARLTEASQRREVLDRLAERDHERWRQEQLAEEARELDEIASVRAGRALIARRSATSMGVAA